MINDLRLHEIASPSVITNVSREEAELMAKELLALRKAFSEPVGYMTLRDDDPTFPRLHKEKYQGQLYVDACNVGPRVTMAELYRKPPSE